MTPDLMLLDLQLRDMTGSALIAHLRERNALVPFVVVTGQGDERVAVETMKHGALDYVMKDAGLFSRLPFVVERALEVVEHNRALCRAETTRRELEKEILEIAEREQQRIGEDLHDGLGQQLTAVEMLCTALKTDVASQPALEKQVARIAEAIRESITLVRLVARGLSPVNEDLDALQVSLIALVSRTNMLAGPRCRFECPEPVLFDDKKIAVPLYRIAQESLNNAMRHGGAKEIVIRLEQTDTELILQISDDGQGLKEGKPRGMGLQVMRHRASSIGAELSVESTQGLGVTVTCKLRKKP
jgi:signal transduction histidine kinase